MVNITDIICIIIEIIIAKELNEKKPKYKEKINKKESNKTYDLIRLIYKLAPLFTYSLMLSIFIFVHSPQHNLFGTFHYPSSPFFCHMKQGDGSIVLFLRILRYYKCSISRCFLQDRTNRKSGKAFALPPV